MASDGERRIQCVAILFGASGWKQSQ